MTRSVERTLGRESRSGLGLFPRSVLAALDHASVGELTLRWPDGRRFAFGSDVDGPVAEATIHDVAAVRRAVLGGSIGLARAYMDGLWDTPDLTSFLEYALANLPRPRRSALRSPLAPFHRLLHRLRDNTRRGAKRNIGHHYDLGNEFYAAWLDPDMTYSSALYDGIDADLSSAQRRKWDRLLSLLELRPGQRLLEIGCGWGGFAIHAAKTVGCHVTGITISDEQLTWARESVAEHGVEDLVEIRHQDYRDVSERYDAVASIEMFEAVGERWWPTFFSAVRDRLEPFGRAALQTIVIAEDRFARYRTKPDFIQRYIFPGGMLPSPSAFHAAAEDAGLTVGTPFFFGADYAMTLRAWERRFTDAIHRVRNLGFDEHFERMWRFYLAYCQAGFRRGAIDVMQVVLERA